MEVHPLNLDLRTIQGSHKRTVHVLRHFRPLTLYAQDGVIRGYTRMKILSRKEV